MNAKAFGLFLFCAVQKGLETEKDQQNPGLEMDIDNHSQLALHLQARKAVL
jgi:hypothetical protein